MNLKEAKPYLLWGALGCTLVVTAHAEYTLATATGVHWAVAGAVPGALDLYVIQALRVHRDVLSAVMVMVAVNVASHLVAAGVLGVHWWLISAVGALAPLLLWRIHFLWKSGAGTQMSAEIREQVQEVHREVHSQVQYPEDDTLWIPSWMTDGCVHSHPECVGAPECTVYSKAEGVGAPGGAGSVPAHPSEVPSTGAPAPETVPEVHPLYPPAGTHLHSVPDLPKGFEYSDTVPTTEQFAAGRELYRDTVALTGRAPSQRAIKSACRCNQDTAKKILEGLAKEFEGATT